MEEDGDSHSSQSPRDPKDILGHSVKEVVKDYRVKEDGVLAYYLQEREIEHHYARNVEERRLMIDDLKTAKELQDEEDQRAEEERIRDAQLAEAMQERIRRDEERKRKMAEERDRMMAAKVLDADLRKEKRQLDKDRRMSEKLAKQQIKHKSRSRERYDREGVRSPGSDSSRSSRDPQRPRSPLTDEEIARRLQEEEDRLQQRFRDDAKRSSQPLSDAEIARRLQEEEKRNAGDDRKVVIEMQDEELAKYIQEQEREAEEQHFYRERMKKKKKQKNSPKKNAARPYSEEEARYEDQMMQERLRYEEEKYRMRNEHRSRDPQSSSGRARNDPRSMDPHASVGGPARSRPDRPPQPNVQRSSSEDFRHPPSRPPQPHSTNAKKLPPLHKGSPAPACGRASSPQFYTEEDFDIVPTQELRRMNMTSQRDLPNTRRHAVHTEHHNHPNEDLNKLVSPVSNPRRYTAKR